MIERIFLIVWGLWLLLVLLAAFRVFGFLIARRFQDRKWRKGSQDQQSVAVIVPVKGFDFQTTPRFFNTLFEQDYSNYRVIVCFESWGDPVAVWLKSELELTETHPFWIHPDEKSGLKSITLVCAGIAQTEGQKVHNQRAAFDHLDKDDSIIAFADADISFKEDWLKKLVVPINQKTHPLSTTYRWLVPKRPTLPNQVASVINGSITTQGGSELTNVLWGGSMAISRSVFDKLDVPGLLEGSVNDDLRLSKAARKAGNRIAFVRSLVLPTMIDFNWRTFFEFAKRQYTQVKFFSPILYTGTNFVLGFYVLGLLSIIGALIYGYFYAWIPIAAAYVIDQFRALVRQQVYLSLFPEDGIRRKLFSAGWLEHMLTPFWMLLHWLLLVSTWTQSRITWAGTKYRIQSKSKTRILERASVTERLPVGVAGLALISSLHDRKRTGATRPIEVEAGVATSETSDTEAEMVSAPDNAETVEEVVPAPDEKKKKKKKKKDKGKGKGKGKKKDKAKEKAVEEEAAALSVPIVHPGVSSRVTPQSAIVRRKNHKKPATSRSRKRGKSTLKSRLSKTRIRAHVLYSPVPLANPGQSLPSGSAIVTQKESPSSPDPEKIAPGQTRPESTPTAASLSASSAAHRTFSGKKIARMGTSVRRQSRSGRTNHVGRSMRGSRVRRPSGNKPSVRSR